MRNPEEFRQPCPKENQGIDESLVTGTATLIESSVLELPNSSIRRWVSPAGVHLFEKRYRQDDKTCTLKVIQSRMTREAIVNERFQQIVPTSPRLGIPKTLEFDFDGARIVMAEAPGRPLLDWIRRRRAPATGIIRGMHLAGQWLKMFQSLPVTESDRQLVSDESLDLADYCQPRVDKIVAAGLWFDRGVTPEAVLALLREIWENDSQRSKSDCWVHGDYGPFNVLWDGRVLTGIDLAMARVESPLVDATYFIHRLEMLALQRPWRRLPVETWKRAFLRGFGAAGAEQFPVYRGLMIRHCLNRLVSMIEKPGKGYVSRAHDRWMKYAVGKRLKLWADASRAESRR